MGTLRVDEDIIMHSISSLLYLYDKPDAVDAEALAVRVKKEFVPEQQECNDLVKHIITFIKAMPEGKSYAIKRDNRGRGRCKKKAKAAS